MLRIIYKRIGNGLILFSKLCRVLLRKPEGKRPLGIPRHRWEDEIRMDLREIDWVGSCRDYPGAGGGRL
jgi:hypothetical protein